MHTHIDIHIYLMWSPKQPIKEVFPPHYRCCLKKSSKGHHQKLIRTNKKMYKATIIECDLGLTYRWTDKHALKNIWQRKHHNYKTNCSQTSNMGDTSVSSYYVSKYLPDELEQGNVQCENVENKKKISSFIFLDDHEISRPKSRTHLTFQTSRK